MWMVRASIEVQTFLLWKKKRLLFHGSMCYVHLPVVGTMPSLPSLQRRESRLVLPAPVRPMHTTSYSGLGGGGPLQHNARKH